MKYGVNVQFTIKDHNDYAKNKILAKTQFLHQIERTTSLDQNSLLVDQNVNGNNEEESHNSLKLVTTKVL